MWMEAASNVKDNCTRLRHTSARVEDTTPLVGILLPGFTAEEDTRIEVPIPGAKETLWMVVDMLSAGQVSEFRWLVKRLDE